MEDLKRKLYPLAAFLVVIWVVEIVNLVSGRALVDLGILPRTVSGLIGIPLAPFLHGSLIHAISNTLPMLVLGGLVLTTGEKRFVPTTIGIVLLGGLAVWLVARGNYHVGASGLVFGYFGVLVTRAVMERSPLKILVGVVVVVVYGGLLFGALPTRPWISFESHIFGLLAGIAIVWLENKYDARGGEGAPE